MSPLRIFNLHGGMVCREVVALLTDYLEDSLPPRKRARLERHLAACPHCTEFLAQLRTTIDAARQIDIDAIDDATRGDLVDLYRRWRAE